MAYDIDLRTHIGVLFSPAAKIQMHESLLGETNLNKYCEITVFRDGPYRGVSQSLQRYFEDGTFARDEYKAFHKYHLQTAGNCEDKDMSAQQFLDFKNGQTLFSLKMPFTDDECEIAYRQLVDFARRHHLRAYDGQTGEFIDLSNPGRFPPMWKSPKPESSIRRWLNWRKKRSV